MPVKIRGLSRPARGNRGKGFDRDVRACAVDILIAQAQGHISSREITFFLSANNKRTANGREWSEAVVRRMLRRGQELGLPFIRYGRSEAASRRKVHRRSSDAIAADLARARLENAGKAPEAHREVSSDAAITSPTISLLRVQ